MEATTQIFMRVQPTSDEDSAIDGEARVEGYDDKRMLIDGFTFGMKAKLQSPGPDDQSPVDNCQFDHLTVDKVFDRASTRLAGLVKPSQGETVPPMLWEVKITLDQQLVEEGEGYTESSRKAKNAIMVFRIYGARVVDYKLNVTEEKAAATAKESVSFTFQNVMIDYYYKGDAGFKNDRETSDYLGDWAEKGKSDYRDASVTFMTEYSVQDDD